MDPSGNEPAHHPFGKGMRLRKSAEFQAVFQRRISVSDKSMVVYGMFNPGHQGRLGLSISKKTTLTAPARNRWKRILREAYRLDRGGFPPGLDIIVLARSPWPGPLTEMRQKLSRLIAKLAKRLGSPSVGPNGPIETATPGDSRS